jgi:hypothetical protein
MKFTRTIVPVILMLCLASCRQSNGESNGKDESPSAYSPFSYEEGDTLRLLPGQAPNLEEWMRFYARTDSAWSISRFPCSGVNIHIDSMEAAPTLPMKRMQAFAPLMAWSRDSSLYIDLWSYNRLIEVGTDGKPNLIGGGPDQMVALSDRSGQSRRQVMFNGPMQVAESADWISADAFLLGMLNLDETSGTASPEIFLFNLSDSVYTNFRYARSMDLGRLPGGGNGFLESWLEGKGMRMH